MERMFFTPIEIPEFPWKMDYQSRIMFMGSCFSESIGLRLADMKFNTDINPFGVTYNPFSVATSIDMLTDCKLVSEKDLFEEAGVWNSFYHHSRFSNVNKDDALKEMNLRITNSHEFLKHANFLFITFGTAWVYELKETGDIVSNCHKVPPDKFKRFRLTPGEIVETYQQLLNALWKFNPNLKIVFTVSPIRHWKDGAIENQRSKATLLLAIDRLVHGLSGKNCGYFPSYEIVMDELRDYRFYADDMLHLSTVAVDHIFRKFSNSFLTDQSIELMKKVVKIRKALDHRPFNRQSEAYEKFLLSNISRVNDLTNSFPYLDFNFEKEYLEKELAGIQDGRL